MKKEEIDKWRDNPIVQIFRESDLSFIKTQEEIGKRWKVPPEGFPLDRIDETCSLYLSYLIKYVQQEAHKRKRGGIPVTYKFLREKAGLTKREFEYIKRFY